MNQSFPGKKSMIILEKKPKPSIISEIIKKKNKTKTKHPFSPNSVSTLKGSYGSCKGQCLIRLLTLGCKFPYQVALVKS